MDTNSNRSVVEIGTSRARSRKRAVSASVRGGRPANGSDMAPRGEGSVVCGRALAPFLHGGAALLDLDAHDLRGARRLRRRARRGPLETAREEFREPRERGAAGPGLAAL